MNWKPDSAGFALALALALAVPAVPAAAQPAAAGAPPAKAQVCAACHTVTGNSTNPAYPILAGQTFRYLYLQLKDFQAGRRHDPSMDPIVATLSADDILALAQWFSQQKPEPTGFTPDPAKVAAGKKKADEVLCSMCHLGGFSGQNEIPRVAGQHYAYIKKQLEDFRAKRRTNDAGNMTAVAKTLTDADIEDLAQYIANLN
ncbi:MAG: c-type cytochrome [Candidatus Levyibacteriota bacterium]